MAEELRIFKKKKYSTEELLGKKVGSHVSLDGLKFVPAFVIM